MIRISENSYLLLKRCLQEHNPELIPRIENNTNGEYSEDFYNQLRQIVGDELIAKGFNSDYSPNEYGIQLENLIDEIGRLFI